MHVQWVAKNSIYNWDLPCFFDCFLTVGEHLENPTTLNLSRLVNFRNKAVSIYLLYLALMIFNFIPANSAKWGEMLDVNIHETNKVVLALKRKKAKARTNAKKSNNTAFVRNPGMENVRVLDLRIQKLSTKILGCLPSPHSTW